MWLPHLIILTATISVIAIKVPVDNTEIEAAELIPITALDDNLKTPIYYLPDDEKSDSFLIPPHQLKEIEVSAPLETPATYLLPPAPGKHIDYYYRPEEPEQTDWYPIASKQKKQSEGTQSQVDDESDAQTDTKYRNGKVLQESQVPQIHLVPPTANAQNDFIILAPSAELELPNENIDNPTTIPQVSGEVFTKIRPHNVHPKLLPIPYLIPPKNSPPKYYPTKLYPKKVGNEFKPIPIPINQYAGENVDKVPMARPDRPFHPVELGDGQYEIPQDNKQVYSYEKAEHQRKLHAPEDTEQHQHVASPSKDVSSEQEASESNYGHPSRNTYPAPLKQSPPVPSKYASANGERTEFRMHGMKGPHSYQFGYDTGKGKNRQFRYEERDNDGHVKGHYGYVDKHGKLRVVNYDADPEHGFRAEAPIEE